MHQMTVREATLATAITVSSETSLEIAETLMLEADSTEVYVTDEAGKLIGVIPDYDILKRRIADDSLEILVRHIMSPVSIQLPPSAPLEEAALLLRMNIHARIPVVVNHRVIGQVTRSTVLKSFRASPEDLHTATEQPEWLSPIADNVIPPPKFLKKGLQTHPVTKDDTFNR